MGSSIFRALVVKRSNEKNLFTRSIEKKQISDLASNDLLIRVHFSSLNYKDALSCLGNPGVTRRYPHTPGIDAAGVVIESESPHFSPGDQVVVAGTPLGMDVQGGFGEYVSIPANWAVHLPDGLTLRESMIFGTAGFTSALSIIKLLNLGLTPNDGTIVVSGATGGVGSTSIALLSKIGFQVSAITGKSESTDFLAQLGATEVINRRDIAEKDARHLLKERWAGGVDTVGGFILENIIKSTKANGAVAVTGLVASQDLSITVLPFILRGISLIGINAQGIDNETRNEIWRKLANIWRPSNLELLAYDCKLESLDNEIDKIISGKQQGRVVIDMR